MGPLRLGTGLPCTTRLNRMVSNLPPHLSIPRHLSRVMDTINMVEEIKAILVDNKLVWNCSNPIVRISLREAVSQSINLQPAHHLESNRSPAGG